MAVHPLCSQEAFQEAGNAELKAILKGTLVAGQPGVSSLCLLTRRLKQAQAI